MVRTDTWLGSGSSVTFIPEADLRYTSKYNASADQYRGSTSSGFTADANGNLVRIELTTAITNVYSELVVDLYQGCTLDIYHAGSYTNSYRIKYNSIDSFYIEANEGDIATLAGTNDYIIVKAFGSPVPGLVDATNVAATATITITDYTELNSTDKVNLIATDNSDYDFVQGDQSSVNGTFEATTSNNATATNLMNVINTGSGPAGTRFSATVDSAVVTVTQATEGAGGNTTITLTDTETAGMSKTNFTGGKTKATLLSDNWLGLVTAVSPPSVDIEMKQVNLALAGSRNWTYQYKGAHTISGVNLSLNANHGAWLYYALGACTVVAATDNNDNPATWIAAGSTASTHDDFLYNTLEAVALDSGPFFHRVIDGTTTICPPLLDYAVNASAGTLGAGYKKITHPNISSGTITNAITYTLGESNTETLPSFALEFAYQKGTELGSASSIDENEEISMARIVTGNQVNTLTLTADENMELTMSVDLSSKALVEPGAGYKIMRDEFDENEFVNFGAPAGNQDTATGYGKEQDFLTPFFFSEGSVKIWNTEYIRIQNVNLTINNTLTDKRFLGVDKKHKHAIPAQRTYEISFTGLVTDNKIFNELLNETADETTANQIELEFTKDNEEFIKLHFKNFMVTNNTWPLPEDKGAIVVEWTIQPIELVKAEIKTHWIIQ